MNENKTKNNKKRRLQSKLVHFFTYIMGILKCVYQITKKIGSQKSWLPIYRRGAHFIDIDDLSSFQLYEQCRWFVFSVCPSISIIICTINANLKTNCSICGCGLQVNAKQVDAIIGDGVSAGCVVIVTTRVDNTFLKDVDTTTRIVGFQSSEECGIGVTCY